MKYAEELELGIPTTPFFKNLDKNDVLSKSEVGFLKGINLPLWMLVNQILDNKLDKQVEVMKKNIERWQEIYENSLKDPN